MGQARVYRSFGLLLLAVGELNRAEECLLKAMKFYTDSDITYYESFLNGELGMVYYHNNNYSKALKYLRKSVSQIDNMKAQINTDMLSNMIDVCESKISNK